MTTCEACGQEADVVVIDDSFDHAFGTEARLSAGSPCCEASVVDDEGRTVSLQDLKDEEEERRAEWKFESARDRALEDQWEEERRA